MANLTIDGVTREISDEIADDEKLLKRLIKEHFGIDSYDTVRGTKDGVKDVTIVKKAQSKGSSAAQEKVLSELLAAPDYINPAVAFALKKREAEEQGDKRFMFVAIQSGEAARAVNDGQKDAHEAEHCFFRVINTAPMASRDIPVGF